MGSEPQGAGLDGTLGRKKSFPGTDDSMDPTSLEVSKARLDTAQSKNQGMALANFGDQLHKEQLSASFGCGSTSPPKTSFLNVPQEKLSEIHQFLLPSTASKRSFRRGGMEFFRYLTRSEG